MTEKEKLKQEKLLKKQAKAKAKAEKSMMKSAQKKQADNSMNSETSKKQKVKRKREVHKSLYDRKDLKKNKEEKQKTDWKLAFKEFPIKMVKEVNKIKWSGKQNLTRKFIQVIIFMAVFAVFFYFVDYGFQALFTAIHVI